jgi:hypothetical protein
LTLFSYDEPRHREFSGQLSDALFSELNQISKDAASYARELHRERRKFTISIRLSQS